MLKQVDKENPFIFHRSTDMIKCEVSDIKLGMTLYKTCEYNSDHVLEVKVRDRVLAERNKWGKVMGQDETLEEYRDFKLWIINRIKENKILRLK